MRIDIFHHAHPGLEEALERIERKADLIMATLDDLVAKVTALQTVDESVVALLQDLKKKLDDAIASGDPAKIQAIVDALGAETDRLAAAVAANTPGAPPAG